MGSLTLGTIVLFSGLSTIGLSMLARKFAKLSDHLYIVLMSLGFVVSAIPTAFWTGKATLNVSKKAATTSWKRVSNYVRMHGPSTLKNELLVYDPNPSQPNNLPSTTFHHSGGNCVENFINLATDGNQFALFDVDPTMEIIIGTPEKLDIYAFLETIPVPTSGFDIFKNFWFKDNADKFNEFAKNYLTLKEYLNETLNAHKFMNPESGLLLNIYQGFYFQLQVVDDKSITYDSDPNNLLSSSYPKLFSLANRPYFQYLETTKEREPGSHLPNVDDYDGNIND